MNTSDKINMKKILILILLLNITKSNSQTPVITLENKDGTRQSGAYYKDTNYILNNYEGIWQYTNGADTLRIELRKITSQFLVSYYEDILVGEVKYVKNGTVKSNTLSALNINYGLGQRHTISGNTILTSPNFLNCTDCATGEKRVYLGFSDPDPVVSLGGYIVLKKTNVSGLEAIKIWIGYASSTKREGEVVPDSTIKYGWYTLTRQ